MRKYLFLAGVVGIACPMAYAAVLGWAISPQTATVCVGGSVKLHAASSDANATAGATQWASDPKFAQLSAKTGSETVVTVLSKPESRSIVVQATATGGHSDSVAIGVPDECPALGNQEVVRAVLALEQTGASGASSGQNFLFDFYITRPALGARVRWWGDVKVATFPQQVNSQLVTLEQQFASTFGNIKVNQLAQAAEFVTGPEFVLTRGKTSRFQMTLFAGGGAAGPNNPTDAVAVFSLPAAGTPAWTAFSSQFGAPPSGAKYVAFLPESDSHFLREWQGGVRLYTMYRNSSNSVGALPGSVEFSIGQNEMVTSGHLSGWVGHVAAMHPFTFTANGKPVTFYLFGEATNAYTHSAFSTPVALAPALSNSSPVPLTDPGVYTISVPANRRDVYRIGIGMDLVSFLDVLFSSGKASSAPAN